MANIIKNRDGKPVALKCPVCLKNKPIQEFVDFTYTDEEGKKRTQWHTQCEKCQKDAWVLSIVNKPNDKDWDDVCPTHDPCIPHHGVCSGGAWTNKFLNGEPVFNGHECVACNGTGKQTYRDRLRNASYWEWIDHKAAEAEARLLRKAEVDHSHEHNEPMPSQNEPEQEEYEMEHEENSEPIAPLGCEF